MIIHGLNGELLNVIFHNLMLTFEDVRSYIKTTNIPTGF
jgi:hypothetical protein